MTHDRSGRRFSTVISNNIWPKLKSILNDLTLNMNEKPTKRKPLDVFSRPNNLSNATIR